MDLISLLVTLIVAGFVGWIITQIPMAEPIRNIVLGVLCLILVLWVLQSLGLWSGFHLRLR